VLRGGPIDQRRVAQAARVELDQARPLRDNGYKVELARNLIATTLLERAT